MSRAPTRHRARALAFLIAATGCVTSACGSPATLNRAETEESFAHLRSSLDAYRSTGFLVGPPDFPVVGRPVVLPGPGDSVYVGFVASMPAAALRFAREDGLVAARYQVNLVLRAGRDTLRRVDHREVVRLTDFEETTSREPRVLFQRFLLAPSGSLRLRVTVRELASRREVEQDFDLEPRPGLSVPLIAYRAEPRESREDLPALIVAPRGTVLASLPPPFVYVEDGDGTDGPIVLSVIRQGVELWSDTLQLGRTDRGPATVVAALPVHLYPPGRGILRAERPGGETDDPGAGATSEGPLFVGLSPEWTPPTWVEAIDVLRYALPSDTVERWRRAGPLEQAEVWRAFNRRSDPDPTTPANEYLALYFERMSEANDRFDEPGRAGWETDRGQVFVLLGAPDTERYVRPERQGEVPRIEWEYEQSVPTEGTIVFEDSGDFSVFGLTPRSRLVLRRLTGELRAEREAEAAKRAPEPAP